MKEKRLDIKISKGVRNKNNVILNDLDITPYLKKSEIVNSEAISEQILILTISLDRDLTNLNVSL